MSEWSDWLDSIFIEEFKDLYEWPGVYKIRLADSRGHPVEIGRLLDKDRNGILMIGESDNVAERIREFYGAYEGDKVSHSEGELLHLIKIRTKFRRGIYDDCRIQFATREVRDKSEAEKEQERLFKVYFVRYGELPPHNRSMPDKLVDWKALLTSAVFEESQ